MQELLLKLINSTQFWLAVSFVWVFIVFFPFILRLLKKTTQESVKNILDSQFIATNLRKSAQKKLEQNKQLSQNKQNIRKSVLKKALADMDVLKKDTDNEIKDALKHKEDELSLKKQILKENLGIKLKKNLIDSFENKIKEHLGLNIKNELHLERLLKAIDENKTMLKEQTLLLRNKNRVSKNYLDEVLLHETLLLMQENGKTKKISDDSIELVLKALKEFK